MISINTEEPLLLLNLGYLDVRDVVDHLNEATAISLITAISQPFSTISVHFVLIVFDQQLT